MTTERRLCVATWTSSGTRRHRGSNEAVRHPAASARAPTEQGAIVFQPTEEVDHPIHVREQREQQNPQQPGALRGTQNGLMGPQGIPPLVAVVSRYPDLLVELPVKVFQLHSGSSQAMQCHACDMQPRRELDRGRRQVNEGVRPQASQNGTRYSVEETSQFHKQAQEDDRMGTIFLPLQIIINRLSPQEPMSSIGQNCGGKYIWKIEHFSQHLQDALNGIITSLESPPIYTGLQEYKFFMRIFLKGINGGDGRYIGLFVGMMQGEYDTILEWPFCGRISLTIKDQSSDVHGFRHDISGTFMANRNLGAFQKPAAAGRYATLYGYAEFAPVATVRTPQYSKDDTVMVKIEIHKNI